MRKVLSSPTEDNESCILFFQRKWMCLYCQGQLCSAERSMVVELRPALRSWEDSSCSCYFTLGHRNRKFGQAQFTTASPALSFPLGAIILHWSGMGPKVKRQSLDCDQSIV